MLMRFKDGSGKLPEDLVERMRTKLTISPACMARHSTKLIDAMTRVAQRMVREPNLGPAPS